MVSVCVKLEIFMCAHQVYPVLGAGERGTAIHTWNQRRVGCQRAGGQESSLLSLFENGVTVHRMTLNLYTMLYCDN